MIWYKTKRALRDVVDDLVLGFAESWRLLWRWSLPITFAVVLLKLVVG